MTELTSLRRQAQRLVDSGNPSPRDARRVLTRLAQLHKRLAKPSGTSQRNNFKRGVTTTISAPAVRTTPNPTRSGRTRDDTNNNVIVRVIHRLAQQRKNNGATTTKGGQWQNVPRYWAEQKEALKHRPAHSKNNFVQVHRQRIIRDAQSSLPSTELPRRRPTVKFTDGPTAR